jgi:hypothetical protein
MPIEEGPDVAEVEAKHAAIAQASAATTAAAAAGKDDRRMSEEQTGSAAVETAAAAAAEEVGTDVETAAPETVASAGADMVSRMIYTGCDALADGVVYAAVFVAQSLPQENPFMHGFRDGGKAADDELGTPAAAAPATS